MARNKYPEVTLTTKMFYENTSYEKLKTDTSLNGLQKIRRLIVLSVSNKNQVSLYRSISRSAFYNHKVFSKILDDMVNVVKPIITNFIDESVTDSSISKEVQAVVSEVFILLVNLWITPVLFPVSQEQLSNRLSCAKLIFDNLNLPVFDNETVNAISAVYMRLDVEQIGLITSFCTISYIQYD